MIDEPNISATRNMQSDVGRGGDSNIAFQSFHTKTLIQIRIIAQYRIDTFVLRTVVDDDQFPIAVCLEQNR